MASQKKKKLTVAELMALKGKRKIVLCTAFDEFTAKAAEEAGVDMIVASILCYFMLGVGATISAMSSCVGT